MSQSSLFLRAVRLNENTSVPRKEYPFTIPALKKFSRLEFTSPITFFIGENGIGKSTLLEAIAVKCRLNAEGGSKNFNFATKQTHSSLSEFLITERGASKLLDSYFFRAESFYTLANEIENLDAIPSNTPKISASYGGKSLHVQSHGEAFLSLITHRLGKQGLYLFDEPEAALSPSRQLAVLVALHDLVQKGCQFIIATHSPILLAYPGAQILEFTSSGIKPISYTDTEHYSITHSFLNQHEQMLKKLLAP